MSPAPFTYDANPGRVVFGIGSLARVGEESARLGGRRVLVITDAEAKAIADAVVEQLGDRVALVWDEVKQHVPIELAERARAAATAAAIDSIVCIGGGSSTGLAKAIALTHAVPVLAVPTTYAGSEMTPIYGLTGPSSGDTSHKATGKDPIVQPRTVVYDPELTVGLPSAVTGPSAFNALAHCVEALYASGANPVITLLALDGIAAIGRSITTCVREPANLDARSDVLYGAYLAGVSLGATGTALHHKCCHVLGGTFHLVHGEVNAVILPNAVAYNAPAVPELMVKVGTALGAPAGVSAARALFDLAASIGAPSSLKALSMPYDGLDDAAARTVADTTVNPRPVNVASVRAMLEDAYGGRRPA
jgi:maleylacetate reductase